MKSARGLIVFALIVVWLGVPAPSSADPAVEPGSSPATASASGERPPPVEDVPTTATGSASSRASTTAAAAAANAEALYRVESGFDLDQYLFRDASPLNFSIDIPDSFGPVTEAGAPAPGNALYEKSALITVRVFDVDEAQGEVDHLYVNGTKLDGQLSGANDQWATDTFSFSTDLLRLPTSTNPSGTNDFYVDIDVNNGGWAVQVDWAELRPTDADDGIRPVAFVHGITGNSGPNGESSMSSFKNYFVTQQPGLAGRAIAPPLTKNDSIATNVARLSPEIDELIADEPIKQIDIVAHSMGGLNSRLYAFDNPGRVRNLVMVATPNAGSRLADIICLNERIPWYLRGVASAAIDYFTNNFGECTGPDRGIYQLQQGYVQNVFNKQVPDLPSVDYATIAGQGNAIGNILLDGEDDGAVTVSSVRYLANDRATNPGLHTSLLPAYERDHSGMIESGSPAYDRALCYIYGSALDVCAAEAAGPASGLAPSRATTTSVESALLAEEAGGLRPIGGPIDTVPAGTSRTYDLTVPAGEAAKLIVNAESPSLSFEIPGTVFADTTMFLESAKVVSFTGPQTLTVTNSGAAESSFFGFLLVSSDRDIVVEAETLAGVGSAVAVTVAISEALPADAPELELVDSAGNVVPTNALESVGQGRWSTTIELPDAGYYSLTAWVEGAEPRGASTPVVGLAGGSLGGTFSESTGDLDGDGLFDWLEVTVPVEVDQAGEYRLAGRIVADDGSVVAVAGTTGSLSAGGNEFALRFDGQDIYASAAPGPWRLTEVMLSDIDLDPLTPPTTLGAVVADTYQQYEHDLIEVSSIEDLGRDDDSDGLFEALDVIATVVVETPGQYALNGKLVSRDGTEVGRTQVSEVLVAGPNQVTLRFDGSVIGATEKDGPFVLRDLAIYRTASPSDGIALVDAHTTAPYRSDEFLGGRTDDPPIAAFSAAVDGLRVSFDASASSDDVGIESFVWAFGDGVTDDLSGATTSHLYGSPGDYSVELVVTDTVGQTASISKVITLTVPMTMCGGVEATIVGDGRSVIWGTSDPDVIVGTSGREVIYGLGGDDIVCAGAGKDAVFGGQGNDRIYGEAGSDLLNGGRGHDAIFGGQGKDVISGRQGNDELHGEEGRDLLFGGSGDDRIFGGAGDDVLYGQRGDDELFGGPGHDRLNGGAGNDVLEQ